MSSALSDAGDSVVEVVDASRTHRAGSTQVAALDRVNLTVTAGDAVAVIGHSGAGKTTLLNLIGGLDHPTGGRVTVLGQDLTDLNERHLTRFRAMNVGMVFQDSYLLPGLNALENVMAANVGRGRRRDLAEEAASLLDAVGLSERRTFPPSRLSGGERQRVGIARAMMGDRPLIVADEPTGNLDAEATAHLLDLFDDLRATRHVALVIATHDAVVAARLPRCLRLSAGRMGS